MLGGITLLRVEFRNSLRHLVRNPYAATSFLIKYSRRRLMLVTVALLVIFMNKAFIHSHLPNLPHTLPYLRAGEKLQKLQNGKKDTSLVSNKNDFSISDGFTFLLGQHPGFVSPSKTQESVNDKWFEKEHSLHDYQNFDSRNKSLTAKLKDNSSNAHFPLIISENTESKTETKIIETIDERFCRKVFQSLVETSTTVSDLFDNVMRCIHQALEPLK